MKNIGEMISVSLVLVLVNSHYRSYLIQRFCSFKFNVSSLNKRFQDIRKKRCEHEFYRKQ